MGKRNVRVDIKSGKSILPKGSKDSLGRAPSGKNTLRKASESGNGDSDGKKHTRDALPKGITFVELIELMLAHDKKLAKEEREQSKRNKLRKKKKQNTRTPSPSLWEGRGRLYL